jgi:hypothetical protein
MDTTPILSIGTGGNPEELFSQIRYARRLPTGEVLVVDGASNELRFFSQAGLFVRRGGGKGSGPAEFRRISGVVLDGDTLRVFDSTLQKIASFDLRGRFAGSQPIASTGSGLHPLRLYRLAGFMNHEALLTAYAFPANMRPVPARVWDSVPTLRYDVRGRLRDTIGEFLGMDSYATPQRTGSIRFGRISSAAVYGNRLYVTDGGHVSVRAYDSTGARQVPISLTRAARPVTAADLARLPEVLRNWPHASTKPAIAQILFDDVGLLWIEQYTAFGDTSAHRWDVFTRSGNLIATMTVPQRIRPYQIGQDFMIAVTRDEDDVEVVREYKLIRD